MKSPFILSTGRHVVFDAFEQLDGERPGIGHREIVGHHAIWAARVPFLPAMLSADFTRLGIQRLPLIRERQSRFIRDLARDSEHRATFELRFIATGNPIAGQPNLIDIVFLGKVFSTNRAAGLARAARLWERFASHFPTEDPFNYPLEPIEEADFARYYAPIPFEELRNEHILEIRKHEDRPLPSDVPLIPHQETDIDYIAHPFVPNVDSSSMGRFFATLADQPQEVCYAAISLRPTRLFQGEIHTVSRAIGMYRDVQQLKPAAATEYMRSRAAVGLEIYQALLTQREQLVAIRVHLVGKRGAPHELAAVLGSEMTGSAHNDYPTQWARVVPADHREFAAALNSLRFLEQDAWGSTLAAPPLERLRYVATAGEAYGAFRLPIPPESGYMPGMLVKSEPFVAPAEEFAERTRAHVERDSGEAKISLGEIYHRGSGTPQQFQISVRDLTRHALIAGSTGSGKTTTIKHLLLQLWKEHRVPFLVLYPLDKRDYRDLRNDPALAEDLLIFTLGDQGTSPFHFNPFEVPPGVLLKTHISRLMSVFGAVFNLVDPLPMIYREALRRVYRSKGWDRPSRDRGDAGRAYPIMSEFHAQIAAVVHSLDYGRDVQATVAQAAVIRIGDLLENAGDVVNVRHSMSLETILKTPTVMELGRVGSMEDTALLMGFLLIRFVEEVEQRLATDGEGEDGSLRQIHVTVVEEAHRLMAETGSAADPQGNPRARAGEDFSNLLAEVRGYGEGIVIAEQIPTLLVKGAIGNTYLKIMHWLEDVRSFELFGDVMNLDAEQRQYTRTLSPGFAIVRSQYGRPVHLKVPEPGDHQLAAAGALTFSDREVKAHMERQRERFALGQMEPEPWMVSLASTSNTGTEPGNDSARSGPWRASPDALHLVMLKAPMHTCVYCKPLHQTGKCRYGGAVLVNLNSRAELRDGLRRGLATALAEDDLARRWILLNALGATIERRLEAGIPDSSDRRGTVYCLLAHAVNDVLIDSHLEPDRGGERTRRARLVLQQFESLYGLGPAS